MVPDNAPSKASLLKWWSQFTHAQKPKKPEYDRPPSPEHHPVFGKPLKESLRRASVQISTANANGDLYVWGYIPVVVAKCGLHLKENATEIEGTFRVNGSAKRMRDLQAAFETPPRYGKSLDWKTEHYTTHDVASVFRRYLTQMPEPVIPHDMYHDFRDVLARKPFNHDKVIVAYRCLISRMPKANQYLLLYVLDLLSVFARKSDKNLMTATNLALIFRPGLISHPNHELSPGEHQLSQMVLEFLIDQQDCFLLDIPPPPRADPSSSWRPPHRPSPRPSHDLDDPDLVLLSSDDERPSAGGWKLVGKDKQRIMRRRTTHEPLDSLNYSDTPQGSTRLSPVAEWPASAPSSPTSLNRSRTLPSQRTGPDDDRHRSRLLRKQKPQSPLPDGLYPGANVSA
ncbi:Rho GTPase activation protein [Boletus coccyginus]|nr:Rho GTPase activation protein [Boletus coccyginus]